MSCDGRRDEILLLAAGLLEEGDAAALRAHLETGCAACARSAREARELDAAMLLGTPEEEAPPRLREAVVALAEPAPRTAGTPTPIGRMLLAAGVGALLAGAPALYYGSRGAGQQEVAVAAATERARELGEQLAALQVERDDLLAERDELDEELAVSDDELTDLRRSIDDARDQIAMLRRDDTQILAMNGTEAQSGARARMFWNWDDYYCYMHATGLSAPPAGSVYAVWLDTSLGGRILAGTLSPERGEAELWVQLPRDIGQARGALVTLEEAEPGQAPKGPVQLVSIAS